MSLDNLVGKSLERIDPDAAVVRRLLAAAARNIEDAAVAAISDETRFDSAYKAIMQIAKAALIIHGFRPLTSKPGHHVTMLQSLPLTLGIPASTVRVLDTLRAQRAAVDYSGDLLNPGSMRSCIAQATQLHQHFAEWLRQHHPELL